MHTIGSYLSIALLATLAFCNTIARAEESRPNVVIILVDDMGYGDPGCFNPKSKIRTPNMDQVASAGMRFTDAHAPGPLCHMSRYGLMTGRYPFRTDVNRWRNHALIEDGQATLASMLKQQGYRTAMVGKWHLGFEENGYDQALPGGPVDVGFDSFFGIRASTDIPPYFYIRDDHAVAPPTVPIAARSSESWSPIQGEFWREGLIAPDMQLQDVLPRFTDEAIAIIESHSESPNQNPLFLYLAYPAPHTPWLPSEEFAGKSKVSMYGDFAEMVDGMIGRVTSALKAADMEDDTLLIITSDNGPVWYEADVERFGHDSAGGLRGMKADAWEAGHRMPFIVRWPSVVTPGSTSEQTIGFTDLFATLAEATGYVLDPNTAPDSFSFLSVLQGKQPSDQAVRNQWLMQSGSGLMLIRDGQWKLIDGLGSGGFSEPKRVQPAVGEPTVQLYNLRTDPSESRNVAAQYPDLVKKMLGDMSAIRSAGHHR